jgi:hypothetical protein
MSLLSTTGLPVATRSVGIPRTMTGRRSWPFLIYVALSLGVTMSLGQYYEEAGGLTYWMLMLPVALLPLTRPMAMIQSALGPGLPATLFALIGGSWHFVRGDQSAALQALLLGWGLIWVASTAARMKIDDLYKLYGAALLVGLGIWLFSDVNQWGLLPGTTTAVGEAVWRVSFFPNVAYTGFFSMLLFMVAARDPRLFSRFGWVIVSVAIYFVLFSFVRAAVVGLLTFVLLAWIYRKNRSPSFLFWASMGMALFVNLAIAYSPAIFLAAQENAVISRLFLRGESGLTEYEIWQQLYRPYVWGEHLRQFVTSPWLMGWGTTDFNMLKSEALVIGQQQSGEISLPTRLLAQYGLPGLLLVVYFVFRLVKLAKAHDAWGCACFPAVIMAMLHWGTMFHPSDFMFGLCLLLVFHGSQALPEVTAAAAMRRAQTRKPL